MKKIISVMALVMSIVLVLSFSASAAVIYTNSDGRGYVTPKPVGCTEFVVTFDVTMATPIDEGEPGYTGQFLMVYLMDKAELAPEANNEKFSMPEFRVMSRHIQTICDGTGVTSNKNHGGLVDFGGKTFKKDGKMTLELSLKNNVLQLTNKSAANLEAGADNWQIYLTFPAGSFSTGSPVYLCLDNHGDQGVTIENLSIVSTDYVEATTAADTESAENAGTADFALPAAIVIVACTTAVIVSKKRKH